MQLHISPSLRHVTVLPSKGVREFVKVKIASRRLSYRMLFYSVLFFTFILRFVFVLTAVETIDGETKCSSLGTLLVIWFCFSFFHMYVTYARTHKSNLIKQISVINETSNNNNVTTHDCLMKIYAIQNLFLKIVATQFITCACDNADLRNNH